MFLDSGKCFGFWEVFLDSGKCFGFREVFCVLCFVFCVLLTAVFVAQ